MAISDIKEYAHLTAEDVEALSVELDAIRRDITDSLGERDAPTSTERSPSSAGWMPLRGW